MRHKNKKSLKNLKQFQNKVRFNFYVRFRPVSQKLFFPICLLILIGAIVENEWNHDLVLENPKLAAVYAIHSVSESGQAGSPETTNPVQDDDTVVPQTQTLGSPETTHSLSSRATSEVEVKIRAAFPEDPDTAVAVAKGESGLDKYAIGYNCHYWNNGVRYSTSCKKEDIGKHWSVDCGVWQINVVSKSCPDNLFDPEENTKIAKDMWSKRGWQPWVAWKNKQYLNHYN